VRGGSAATHKSIPSISNPGKLTADCKTEISDSLKSQTKIQTYSASRLDNTRYFCESLASRGSHKNSFGVTTQNIYKAWWGDSRATTRTEE
jgi:hypothetical protein